MVFTPHHQPFGILGHPPPPSSSPPLILPPPVLGILLFILTSGGTFYFPVLTNRVGTKMFIYIFLYWKFFFFLPNICFGFLKNWLTNFGEKIIFFSSSSFRNGHTRKTVKVLQSSMVSYNLNSFISSASR